MELDIAALLRDNTTLLFFLVVGIGYIIGKRKIGSIEVGSTTGVLLAGLFLGHFGFQTSPDLANLGFTLFIFSVGYQAGPRFFSVFLQDGAKYVALAVVVAVTGSLLAVTLARVAGFDYGVAAGLLGGALTSTPTLAGAQDAVTSGLATLPEGISAQQALENISVGYAITYLFGTIGLIVFIRYFPILLRIDLHEEAVALARERGLKEEGEGEEAATLPLLRVYRATIDEAIGRSLRELQRKRGYKAAVLRIRRGDEIIEPDGDTVIEKDDLVAIVAGVQEHREAQELLGNEVLDEELLDYHIESADIVISTPHAVGKPIADLEIVSKFGCFPSGVRRAGIKLSYDPQMALAKGDILTVTGEESRLKTLVEELGFVERQVEETDLVVLSFAIVIGLVFGTLLVKLGQLQIGLGSAGGLLLAGILVDESPPPRVSFSWSWG
jgi:putative transport protein